MRKTDTKGNFEMQNFIFDQFQAEAGVKSQMQYDVEKNDRRAQYTFSVTWNPEDMAAVETPKLIIRWSQPVIDIQYQWHSYCGANRNFGPNWGCRTISKISAASPLHCFYNDAAQNRLTIALDDCVTLVERHFGVREEDGTLECRVEIPLDATGKTDRYQVTLWIDETDCRYEEAIGAVAAWWEKKYPPMQVPEAAKLPTYSFWYSFHQQVYAAEVEAECARAAKMGFTTVIVDDGWQTDDNSRGYAYCGDWQNAAAKIPDMRAHVDAVHKMGLKYMLWYSVPFVGCHSEVAKRFEGKTLEYQAGMNAYTLDPRYPEVRQYLIDTYVKALKEWDLDGFKLDFIDSFRMTKDTPAFREGMDYVVLEDAVHVLMVDVKNALCAIKPEILIEFRQSYIGPVMREFGNMFRVSDCPYMTSTNRIGMVDLRLTGGNTAVHSDPLMWNSEDRVENAVCQMQNIIFGTMQLSVRLDRVPEEHIKAIRFWMQFMQQEKDLLQNAPIHAECPQMHYPLVWTEKGDRSIVACYQKNYLVNVNAAMNDVYILNANSGRELLLAFDQKAAWTLTVCDCMGEVVRETQLENDLLMKIDVPECGLIRLKKA